MANQEIELATSSGNNLVPHIKDTNPNKLVLSQVTRLMVFAALVLGGLLIGLASYATAVLLANSETIHILSLVLGSALGTFILGQIALLSAIASVEWKSSEAISNDPILSQEP